MLSDRPPGASAPTYPVPGTLRIVSTRPAAPGSRVSRELDALIEHHARVNQVPAELVRAVIQTESAFNPTARSPKGAMGLMQLMPATAAGYGVRDPYDPAENIRGGVRYLRDLLDKYDGDETLALAAYNAGPTAVDQHGRRVPPYPETLAYVARVREGASLATSRASTRIYRVTQVEDGRERILYTNRALPGAAEVPAARRR